VLAEVDEVAFKEGLKFVTTTGNISVARRTHTYTCGRNYLLTKIQQDLTAYMAHMRKRADSAAISHHMDSI
jgi:hypothetical protein